MILSNGCGNMRCRRCDVNTTIVELNAAPAIDIEQAIYYNRECNVAIQHDWVPYNTDNTTYITYKCKHCGDIKTVK